MCKKVNELIRKQQIPRQMSWYGSNKYVTNELIRKQERPAQSSMDC